MASFNVTADDSTPLIAYTPAGAWIDTADGDPTYQSYSGQSYHRASTQGATATISFNGTGIWLFGAKRPDYGAYSISIDGDVVQGSAQSAQQSFQQMLGGKSGLPMGSHTMVLTNTGSGSGIDIDSMMFETQVGSAGSTFTNTTTDDTSPSFTYLPTAGDWSINNLQGCINNTLHFTQTGGAQVQYTFNGDAVALYGTTSPDHANYTVSVDGATMALDGGSNGDARILHPNTLLYFGTNFGPGDHLLTLTANPSQAGQANTGKFMDIDAITVYNAGSGENVASQPDSNPSNNGQSGQPVPPSRPGQPGSSSSSAGGSQSKTTKTGLIIGIVAAVAFLLLLLILVVTLLVRRKRRQRSRMPLQSPGSPVLPFQAITPGLENNRFSFARSKSQFPQQNPFADPNPFVDPEKGGFAPGSGLPMSRSTSVMNHYSVDDMPRTPRTSVMRESYRVDDDDLQVKSGAWTAAPQRPPRPPTLRLPPGA